MTTYGYSRVSTTDQCLDRQHDALAKAGAEVIVSENKSGKNITARPALTELLGKLEAGDKLIVMSLDRLGRNTLDVIATLDDLEKRSVAVVVLDMAIDSNTPAGKLMTTIVAAFAQMERETISNRVKTGIAAAKQRGAKFGNRADLTECERAEIREMFLGGWTVTQVREVYGDKASRQAFYNFRNDALKEAA
ncbi:DNA invertase Pin-like site-specific DNA recombinase [Labrenzia sp. EL_126]|nr:DNA invertase Pin-like site-specific DNA recombinase [Labrenzia sp. EL_126]